MAYTRRRKPARRRPTASRVRREGDSLSGVMLIQVVITLCLISGLYFATLGGGGLAAGVRAAAAELINRRWEEGEIKAAMGRVAELTPIEGGWSWSEIRGGLYGGTEEDARLGEAVLAATQPQQPQPLPPTEPLPTPLPEGPLPSVGDSPPPALPVDDNVDAAIEADAYTADPPEMVLKPPVNTAAGVFTSAQSDKAGAAAPALSGMSPSAVGLLGPAGGITGDILLTPVHISARLSSPVAGRVSSRFGARVHPVTKKDDFHTGVDIVAPRGSDILSALPGEVVIISHSQIYGNSIVIDHGGGVQTRYCHCDSIIAKEGDKVAIGARIATVGSTGLTTGPHLHFELIIGGLLANPLPHLKTVAAL